MDREENMPTHLFQPGQSGNPAGRPKGARDRAISTYLLNELATKVRNGEEEKTKLEALVKKLIDDALNGNYKAMEIVLDRAYGKAKEIIEAQISAVRIIDSLDEGELLEEGSDESGYLASGEVITS